MEVFNKVKQLIKTGANGVAVMIDLRLPAVNKTYTNQDGIETVKVIADPSLSAQEMFDTLSEYWDEDFLKGQMLSRFISVVAMDRVRREIVKYLEHTPDAKIDELEKMAQEFVDSGWNRDLCHPVTDRKQKSEERKVKDAENLLKSMGEEQLKALLAERGITI